MIDGQGRVFGVAGAGGAAVVPDAVAVWNGKRPHSMSVFAVNKCLAEQSGRSTRTMETTAVHRGAEDNGGLGAVRHLYLSCDPGLPYPEVAFTLRR